MCVASLSLRSKFICLSLMAISRCHTTKLLTIDRECLFNRDSSSSSPSPSPSVWLRLAFMCALSLVCRWPSSCGFTALGLHSKRGVDALCQVILSLGKSAMGNGKMALTCLHTGSDGWLPVSFAALMAQGPCLLVLSETCSCPNEGQGSSTSISAHSLLPDNTTLQLAELLTNNEISQAENTNLNESPNMTSQSECFYENEGKLNIFFCENVAAFRLKFNTVSCLFVSSRSEILHIHTVYESLE